MPLDLSGPLAPYQPLLALFQAPLVPVLEGLVRRLLPMFGPLQRPVFAGAGEPDGVTALARRGEPDRLVASEWLLAEELPEEFWRRQAEKEALYLALARKDPQGACAAVALLDAGPEVLGAPRVVMIALWLILMRRALAAHAAFSWAPLQRTPPALVEATSPDGEDAVAALPAFLAARTVTPATPALLAAWEEPLTATAAPLAERWWVGGAALGRLAASRGSRVVVEEVWEDGEAAISVAISPPHALTPRARTLVPLAALKDGLAALTQPLRPTAPAAPRPAAPRPARPSPSSKDLSPTPILHAGFTSWGDRVLLLRADRVEAHSFESPSSLQTRWQPLPEGPPVRVLSLDYLESNLVFVTVPDAGEGTHDATLWGLWGNARKRRRSLELGPLAVHALPTRVIEGQSVAPPPGRMQRVDAALWARTADGGLLTLSGADIWKPPQERPLVREAAVWLTRAQRTVVFARSRSAGGEEICALPVPGRPEATALMGTTTLGAVQDSTLWVWAQRTDVVGKLLRYTIPTHGGLAGALVELGEWPLLDDMEILGPSSRWVRSKHTPGLWAWRGQEIVWMWQEGIRTHHTVEARTARPVVEAALSREGRYLVTRDTDGEVVLWDSARGHVERLAAWSSQ